MPTYNIEIVVNGRDNASGALGSVHGALGNIAQIAAGGVIAAGIVGIGKAIAGAAQDAFGSVASYERLGLSLQALAARELVRESTQTRSIAIGTQVVQATGAQSEKMADLSLRIREAQLRYDDMERSKQYWAKNDPIKSGLNQVELEQRAAALAKLKAEYDKLNDGVGKSVTLYRTETTVGKSREQAWGEAATRARELQAWIAKVAILSPFNQDDVAQAFRMSMAYGFTTKESQRLTQAMIDFTSATGASGDVMQRVMLALGQIQAKGKLAGGEVLQLTNAGLNVRDILARAFGKTTAEIQDMQEKGLIPAKDAIEAITKSLEEDFGGAAKTQAGSLSGLTSSLHDLKQFAEIDIFQPLFRSLTPILTSLTTFAQQPAVKAVLQDVGNALGRIVSQPFGGVVGFLDKLNDLMTGEMPSDNPRSKLTGALGLGQAFRVAFKESFPDAQKVYDDVKAWWETQVVPKFKTGFTVSNLLDFASAQIVNVENAAAAWLQKLAESGEVEKFGKAAGDVIGNAIRIVLSFKPEQLTANNSGLEEAAGRVAKQFFDGFKAGLEKELAGFDLGAWLTTQLGKTWGKGGAIASTGTTILELLGIRLPTKEELIQAMKDAGASLTTQNLNNVAGSITGPINSGAANMFAGVEASIWGVLDPNAGGQVDAARWQAIGQAYMSGIAQGVASETASFELAMALQTVTDNGVEQLKLAYGIQSPSRVLAATVGEPLVQGMAQGALQSQAIFVAALTTVVTTSQAGLTDNDSAAAWKSTGQFIMQTLADSIRANGPLVRSALQDAVQGNSNWLKQQVWNWVNQMLRGG